MFKSVVKIDLFSIYIYKAVMGFSLFDVTIQDDQVIESDKFSAN